MNSKLVLLASALIIVTIFYSCKPKKGNEVIEIDPLSIEYH